MITIATAVNDGIDSKKPISIETLRYNIRAVSEKLDALELNFYNKKDNYIENAFLSNGLENSLFQITDSIIEIKNFYKKYLHISKHKNRYSNEFLDNLADQMISYNVGYPTKILESLESKFFSKNVLTNNNLLDKLLRYFEENEREICDMGISPQHQLVALYNKIVSTEVQGLGCIVFALLWKKNRGKKQNEPIRHLKQFEPYRKAVLRRLSKYTNGFRNIIKSAPNSIRRCDPPKQEYSKTYIDVNDLVYTFIANQLDFKPPGSNNCWNSCGDIKTHEQNCEKLDDYNFAYRNSCPGRVFDCEGDTSYAICRKDPADKKSTKLYNWFLDKQTEEIYGDIDGRCYQDIQHAQKYSTWLLLPCYYCICKCEDNYPYRNTDKIRAISFLWSSVNWRYNMVATGVRLYPQDRMIHIQLRQGKLLPNGQIDKTTESWVPLPKFSFKNHFPHKLVYPTGTEPILIQGFDYGLIRLNYTKIGLNKLIVKEGHLLTGIKFKRFVINKNETFINKLLAKYAKFDYENGRLIPEMYYSPPEEYQPKLPTELILHRPDDPLKLFKNLQDSNVNQFIRMRVSNLEKDASQTTIPFFDLLKVITQPSMPIRGIEIFHKGDMKTRGSGGYISLKIYPIDPTMHMVLEPNEIENKIRNMSLIPPIEEITKKISKYEVKPKKGKGQE